MKLNEAQALKPTNFKEELLKAFSTKTAGQFYGGQEMLKILWPKIEALEAENARLMSEITSLESFIDKMDEGAYTTKSGAY